MITLFFFFNDTATTEIYTLSLHDALPISAAALPPPDPSRNRAGSGDVVGEQHPSVGAHQLQPRQGARGEVGDARDRKSTRLNSSHANISYAVFCLKKKHETNRVSELHAER